MKFGKPFAGYRSNAYEYRTMLEPIEPGKVREMLEQGWEELGRTSSSDGMTTTSFKRKKPPVTIITGRRGR